MFQLDFVISFTLIPRSCGFVGLKLYPGSTTMQLHYIMFWYSSASIKQHNTINMVLFSWNKLFVSKSWHADVSYKTVSKQVNVLVLIHMTSTFDFYIHYNNYSVLHSSVSWYLIIYFLRFDEYQMGPFIHDRGLVNNHWRFMFKDTRNVPVDASI